MDCEQYIEISFFAVTWINNSRFVINYDTEHICKDHRFICHMFMVEKYGGLVTVRIWHKIMGHLQPTKSDV
jgi:hypothetical protein